jgi:hypothetical protein
VDVRWGRGAEQRHDASEAGRIVDRGRFDHLLLEHARSLGVRILQPARFLEQHPDSGRTLLEMARDWSPTVALPLGLSISRWLVARGLLVPVIDLPCA